MNRCYWPEAVSSQGGFHPCPQGSDMSLNQSLTHDTTQEPEMQRNIEKRKKKHEVINKNIVIKNIFRQDGSPKKVFHLVYLQQHVSP